LVELEDRLGELVEGVVVVEGPLDEADALLEVTPRLLAERGPGVLLDGFADDLREVLRLPLTAREAREREARGEQPAVGQVVDRRHELLAGEVARDAEDHESARPGD